MLNTVFCLISSFYQRLEIFDIYLDEIIYLQIEIR